MRRVAGGDRVDWNYWIRQRDRQIVSGDDVPRYLLAPEMERLIRDRTSVAHEFLFATMWHTGAKISEVLSLTPKHFLLTGEADHVVFGESRNRRCVPLVDAQYKRVVARMLKAHKGKASDSLLGFSRQTASAWLAKRVKFVNEREGGLPAFPITLNTLRHSFAFHALLHHVPLETLQQWLGHNQPELTRRYMRFFDNEPQMLMRRLRYP